MKTFLVILGGGESGTGAALLAKHLQIPVFLSDNGAIPDKFKSELIENDIQFEENGHNQNIILTATEVIKSPGIPDKAPLVKELHRLGIPVISELEFAARYTKAKFIAITGSNGKTTTTLLTYHLLKESGFNVGLGGNIGLSLARQVIANQFDWYVLEVSSFQLDGMHKFKADIAILLNITPDHLDRYEYKFENYIASKFRIVQNQGAGDTFITYKDSEVIAQYLEQHPEIPKPVFFSLEQDTRAGAWQQADGLHIHPNQETEFLLPYSILPMTGKHNYLNTMAASLAASKAGLNAEQIAAHLPGFKNAHHRLEFVAEINGVRFINDSKATNVDSVKYALGSFEQPIIWIAGGIDKGNDYSLIEDHVLGKVKSLVCLGKDNSKLTGFFCEKIGNITETQSVAEAVRLSLSMAQAGDVVLLSPACASFDLFRNYEDRGDQFMAAVRDLRDEV